MRFFAVVAAGLAIASLAGCDESDTADAGRGEYAPAPRAAVPRPAPVPAPVRFHSGLSGSGAPTDAATAAWSRNREYFDGGRGASGLGEAVSVGPAGTKTISFTAAARKLTPYELPAPPPPASRENDDLDERVASHGERTLKKGGTFGLCYGGVKRILRKLGIVKSFTGDARWRDADGRGVRGDELEAAYQFPRWVERHPSLHGRRLQRLPNPSWPLATSDIVVWGRGVCGYRESGHIEILYKISPDARNAWAVSDHSSKFDVACYEREAARVSRAREGLADAYRRLAEADRESAAARVSGDARAARAARAAQTRAKSDAAALERVSTRLEAYRIERPVPPAATVAAN